MKVSVSKIENNAIVRALPKMQGSKQSFGAVTKVSPELMKLAGENLPGSLKKLVYWGNNDGEIMNTIITGLGTAFVAPLFIAFNPFSKEDKDIKAYSAWRQPISAVLAVAAQIAINLKWEHYLDRLASTGGFDRANLKAMPQKSYLKHLIKFKSPKKLSKEELEAQIHKLQDEAKRKQITIARREHNGNPAWSDLVGKEHLQKAEKIVRSDSTLASKIQGLKEKEAKKYLEPFIKKEAEKIVREEIYDEARIKRVVRSFKEQGLSRDEAIELVQQRIQRLMNITDEAKSVSKAKALGLLQGQLKKLEDIRKFEEGNKAIKNAFDSVKDLGSSFKEVLENVKIKRLVIKQADDAKIVLKNFKRWTGIVISLITLPFSCGLLNWAYPRIMEKIMPEASKKKKAKEAGR